MKIRVLFGLSVGVLSLASLASAAAIPCVTPGPNPDNLVTCSSNTSSPRFAAAAPITYSVDETAVVDFTVPVAPGDLVLCDNAGVPCDASNPQNWNDVLRFLSTGPTSGSASLFSDNDELGVIAPLDINLTTLTLQPVRLFSTEVGSEANNGIVYNNGDSIGTITSDSSSSTIPEPSSLLLLGSALVAGLLVKRRR